MRASRDSSDGGPPTGMPTGRTRLRSPSRPMLEVQPRRVLEVGCGPGEAAERIAAGGARGRGARHLGADGRVSPERAASEAQVGDVQQLPFEDESFDAALAAWMLYHVPTSSAGSRSWRACLKPGGRLVAVTNRSEHLRELRELLGGVGPSQFNDENARAILLRHFAHVEERDAGGSINFPDRAAVEAYVEASRALWARDLPEDFDGPLEGSPGPRHLRGDEVIRPAELIERKRNGEELAADEIAELILGYARGEIPDYQLAAFCMAVYFKGLNAAETYALTDAMIRSGRTLDLGAALGRKVVDKHSTGGVGDKTTIAVGPIVAACGVPVGKMSGRGLGHTGGTLDKLESIPGFSVEPLRGRVRRAGAGRRARDHRPDRRSRPGRQAALRAPRRDGDGRHRAADRVVDHVEEDRRWSRRDRARRQGRRRRLHEDARGCAGARRGDARARAARRP